MEVDGKIIFGGVLASYLVGYTAWSKTAKKLDFGLLKDVILVRKSWDHSMVELNKSLALAGLTCLGLSFLPQTTKRRELYEVSTNMLMVHSAYSVYKFYGDKHIPKITTWPRVFGELTAEEKSKRADGIKKVSVVLGSVGLLAGIASELTGDYGGAKGVAQALNVFDIKRLGLVSLGLGLGHFITMEVDYKLVLQVRPYAYLAIILPLVGLGYGLSGRRPL